MHSGNLETLVSVLLDSAQMQALWRVNDRGMPVFAHSIDVTLLALDKFPEVKESTPTLDLRVVTLGSLIHDLSKATARETPFQSHSRIMSYSPQIAADEARQVIDEMFKLAGEELPRSVVDAIIHVVVSHHGPWGQIHPQTPEARLVHNADLFSATHHRMAPVDANDILPHLDEGRKWATIAALLGVSTTVLRQRIGDACRAEMVGDWPDLLKIWRRQGHVVVGDEHRVQQLNRVRFVLRSSREVPESILRVLASMS